MTQKADVVNGPEKPSKGRNCLIWIGSLVFGLVLQLAFCVLSPSGNQNKPTKTFPPNQEQTQRVNDLFLSETENPIGTPYSQEPVEITDEYGIPMVLVPEGYFEMGMDADRASGYCGFTDSEMGSMCIRSKFEDEEPPHIVFLDTYYIDKFEVTNAAYRDCVEKGPCEPPAENGSHTRDSYYGNTEFDDYPVIFVNWYQAQTYCEWRGGRLPTEAEWEKAARGTDGRPYPWGFEFDGTLLNFCEQECDPERENKWSNPKYDDGFQDTAPVGSYPAGASPYGAMDMAGNVFEWVFDYMDDEYYFHSPVENPQGPLEGSFRVLRSSCWSSNAYRGLTIVRNSFYPGNRNAINGIRCARSD